MARKCESCHCKEESDFLSVVWAALSVAALKHDCSWLLRWLSRYACLLDTPGPRAVTVKGRLTAGIQGFSL